MPTLYIILSVFSKLTSLGKLFCLECYRFNNEHYDCKKFNDYKDCKDYKYLSFSNIRTVGILIIIKIVKTVNCCSFNFFSSLFIVTKCTM